MTISRSRIVRWPRSSRPELKKLKNSHRSRAIVVKSTSGGAPRMMASIASCLSGCSGGDTGAMRALWFTRLRELRELGIVDHSAGGYRLTEHGRTLMTALEPLQHWADDWAAATVS
jgi:hypothetical protein